MTRAMHPPPATAVPATLEEIAQKAWCFPVDPAMRLCGDMIEWCTTDMPRWRFESRGDADIQTLRIDPALERKQLARLQGVRARRDGGAVEATLAVY